jgi:hypothetical protein
MTTPSAPLTPSDSTRLCAFVTDADEARRRLTRRRGFEEPDLSPRMKEGIRRVFDADLSADEVVDRILGEVRTEGDAAVLRYAAAFDGQAPDTLEVPRSGGKVRSTTSPKTCGTPSSSPPSGSTHTTASSSGRRGWSGTRTAPSANSCGRWSASASTPCGTVSPHRSTDATSSRS